MTEDAKAAKTEYITLDVYLAGYLSVKGLTVNMKPVEGTDKIGFLFEKESAIPLVREFYDQNSSINPVKLVREIKHLRGQMLSMKEREIQREAENYEFPER